MTRDEFDALLANGSELEILEAVSPHLPESEDDLGRSDGDLIAVVGYAHGDLCNGGFYGFYANGSFDPHRLIEDLRRLELSSAADAVAESLTFFPQSVPPIRLPDETHPIDERLEAMGLEMASFYDLNDRYYEATEEIQPAFVAWIRRNADRYWSYTQSSSA